jgi:hypothetical protein
MNVDLANLASPPRESERVTELIGMKGFDSRWLDLFIRFVCLFVCLFARGARTSPSYSDDCRFESLSFFFGIIGIKT